MNFPGTSLIITAPCEIFYNGTSLGITEFGTPWPMTYEVTNRWVPLSTITQTILGYGELEITTEKRP